MEIAKLTVQGFRRFAQQQTLQLFGKVLAIVGPNEAGKTSLLDALSMLVTDAPVPAADITRDLNLDDGHKILEALFLLRDDDRKALANVDGGAEVRWFLVSKSIGGERTFSVIPKPHRDRRRRQGLLARVRKFIESPAYQRLPAGPEESESAPQLTQRTVQDIGRLASVNSDDLTAQQLEQLAEAARLVRHAVSQRRATQNVKSMLTLLDQMIEHEKRQSPETEAANRLQQRLPHFLEFTGKDRALRTWYDLSAYFRDSQRQPIPNALVNLCEAGHLKLERLWDAVRRKLQSRIQTLTTAAEEPLDRVFESWTQSGVKVRFAVNGNQLHVQIEDERRVFSDIGERSDGLKHFVALVAFASRHGHRRPVLLIDEAERHLHYDAQADLVRMLTTQAVASKVIYSTHSMGCLPEDLGVGVRMVSAESPDRSTVVNRFWSDTGVGLQSLLFGIGASTLAYVPMRSALMVEGPSDLILLPTLFRAAKQADEVGFQVVPGLASAEQEEVALLRGHGRKVAYLVDNDDGGSQIRRKLRRAGVPEKLIFSLPEPVSCIEDALNRDLYKRSVTQELRKANPPDTVIDDGAIVERNRPGVVADWCAARGLKAPSKPDIAYQVLDVVMDNPDEPVLEENCVEGIRDLHDSVARALHPV